MSERKQTVLDALQESRETQHGICEDAPNLLRLAGGRLEGDLAVALYDLASDIEESTSPGSPAMTSYAALAKRMESHAVEAEETMGESGSPNIKNRYKGLAQGYREAARMLRECAA